MLQEFVKRIDKVWQTDKEAHLRSNCINGIKRLRLAVERRRG